LQGDISKLRGRDEELAAGIAVAAALAMPDRTGDQTWALAANWGNYDSYNAFSVTGIAALASDVFTTGDQVSLGGGIGFSTEEGQVAGRVSVQIAGGPPRSLR
jgi:hypothetical protein